MRGRGCVILFSVIALSSPGQAVETLSGQSVTLKEVLLDENPGALWVRFRFLAPELSDGAQVDPMKSATDMQGLCDEIAVPYLVDNAISPAKIVISMADRIVPFGQPDPEATQIFELFRLENKACIWEEF